MKIEDAIALLRLKISDKGQIGYAGEPTASCVQWDMIQTLRKRGILELVTYNNLRDPDLEPTRDCSHDRRVYVLTHEGRRIISDGEKIEEVAAPVIMWRVVNTHLKVHGLVGHQVGQMTAAFTGTGAALRKVLLLFENGKKRWLDVKNVERVE